MAKIIAWLILIFIVLFVLRMVNVRKARSRRADAARSGTSAANPQPMVRCVRCSVFLPRAEATPVADGYACAEGQCIKR